MFTHRVLSLRLAAQVLAVSSAIVALGCGGDRHGASISGTITVNGTPLENGKIVLRPLDPTAGAGASADVTNGSYELERVPLGASVFMFSGAALTGKSISGPGGAPEPERVNVIPQQILRDGVEREITQSGTQDFALDGPA